MFNSSTLQVQYGLQLLEPWIFHQTPTLIKKLAICTILMTSYRATFLFLHSRGATKFAVPVRLTWFVRFPFLRSRGAARVDTGPSDIIRSFSLHLLARAANLATGPSDLVRPFLLPREARCASSGLRATTSLLINARLPVAFQLIILYVRVSSARLKIWKEFYDVTTDGGEILEA